MAAVPQFKLNQLAKDLGVKTKDMTDILKEKGYEGKPQKVLEAAEFDVLFEALTKANQVVGIEDYIDGITYIPTKEVKTEEKPAEKKPEAKVETPKTEEKKPEVKVETPKTEEKKPEAKVEAPKTAEKKPEAKVEAPKTEEKKPEVKVEAPKTVEKKPEAKVEAHKKETPKRENAATEQKPAQRQDNNRPQDRPQGQNGQRFDNNRQGQRPEQGQRGDRRHDGQRGGFDGQRGEGRPAGQFQPRDGGRQDNRQGGQFGGRDNRDNRQGGFDRDNRQGGFDKGGFDKGGFDKGGFDKGGFDRQGGGRKPEREHQGPPKEKFQAQPIIRGAGPVKKDGQGGKRIVDTRGGGDVDLSKYDDKFTNITPDYARDMRGGSERVKRGNKGQQQVPKNSKFAPKKAAPIKKQPVKVSIPDEISVGELASRLKVTSGEVVKRLMLMGMMVTVNEFIDYDTAYLVADELGAEVTKEVTVTIEDKLFEDDIDAAEDLTERAPVVCVMGHVDHGKTSLLDAIRHTSVTTGEAGGITQHIGAYRVKVNGKELTFLDTPGHEAFTAMRARGAQATDIAILVVAADDGVMPQTVEAINHAKAAGIDIIVAINKMDKPTANPDHVLQELTKYELVPEEWGGDVICVPVSALTGRGIDDLLENVLLVAEVKELKANPNRHAKGIVIEAKLDRGRGPVATVLVQNGTLHNGDVVIAGTAVGHVRAMTDHNGKHLKAAGPSVPVEITGLAEVPSAGDEFNAVDDEKMARELAEQRRSKAKEDVFKANARANLNDLFAQISEGVKNLNVIVKADVGGSAEAVKASLEKISNEEVKVKVIHSAAGGITEGDVMFAAASNAIIVGFNVRPDKAALDSAERQSVEIRTYRVIYECIEEITAAMKGMLAPKFKETLLGHAEVRQTIHVPNVGTIAGSYVQDGKITRASQIRVVRSGIVIFEDKVSSLRRFKDDVREVATGYECGIGLERFNDIKVGDILEVYIMEEIAR